VDATILITQEAPMDKYTGMDMDREQIPSVNHELFSWKRNISDARKDIEIAREAKASNKG
jgi:hypothetical protein